MTQAEVCFKFKFGFCKYSERCKYRHVTLVCDDYKCDVSKCEKRHPKLCRYYRDYKRCKFTVGCMYKHENQFEMFEKIEKKLKEVKCNHSEKDIQKITSDVDEKLERMENKIEFQSKQLEESNSKITGLELRLEELEKKYSNEKKSKDKKIKDLENLIKMKNEKALKDIFKCEYCDFETPSERGLNVHIKRKHTNLKADKYPVECDFCEFNAKSESEMKFHLKNVHTAADSNFKCVDCDFCAYNQISIQVHQGREHEDGFTCGLCDFKADSLEMLNLHLKTCESYECNSCNLRVYTISDIRDHIKDKHESDYVFITHGKLDRKDENYVKETSYEKDKLLN